jgi:anti-anti-sigma factor
VPRLPLGLSQRLLDFNYQDFANLRYARQLMETVRLELQQSQDSGNGDAITRLNGKLGLETVNSFLQTMRKEPAQHLVLEMSGVAFLDSAGVGALVSLFVTRKRAGKTLALANLTKQAIAVLQVSGILKLIPSYPTLEAASKARE